MHNYLGMPKLTAEEITDLQLAGMLRNPHVPCPDCGKKTNAKHECPHCHEHWSYEQLRLREQMRRKEIVKYDDKTKEFLNRVP
jgi:tRNA(Ile2) C34 agmatinyltransferase TiaS